MTTVQRPVCQRGEFFPQQRCAFVSFVPSVQWLLFRFVARVLCRRAAAASTLRLNAFKLHGKAMKDIVHTKDQDDPGPFIPREHTNTDCGGVAVPAWARSRLRRRAFNLLSEAACPTKLRSVQHTHTHIYIYIHI